MRSSHHKAEPALRTLLGLVPSDPTTKAGTPAELTAQITALQGKLTTMPQIEQAKGAVMVVLGLTEEAAYALLRWYSQNRNAKLRDIAAGLTTESEPEPLGAEASSRLTQRLEALADRHRR